MRGFEGLGQNSTPAARTAATARELEKGHAAMEDRAAQSTPQSRRGAGKQTPRRCDGRNGVSCTTALKQGQLAPATNFSQTVRGAMRVRGLTCYLGSSLSVMMLPPVPGMGNVWRY